MSQRVLPGSFNDTMARVAPWIGVPYVNKGRSPETGWDCWGCCRHVRREVFGVDSPSWAEVYEAGLSTPELEEVIRQRLRAWRKAELLPGAALLFRMFGRNVHVGVYLGRNQFIHALQGCETAVEDLTQPRWKGRLVSPYECC